MRILSCFVLCSILICGNFFCSDSPFDSATDLGQDLIDINFYGVVFEDSLKVAETSSFIDILDSIQSGYFPNPPYFHIGNWRNEKAIGYIEINTLLIDSAFAQHNKNNKKIVSLLLEFNTIAQSNAMVVDAKVDIGLCEKKVKKTQRTITEIVQLYIRNVPLDSNLLSIPIKTKFLDSTSEVIDTFSQRNVLSNILTRRDSLRITSIDTLIDTNNIVTYDTTFDTLMTLITSSIFQKTSLYYDSVTPPSLIINSNYIDTILSRDTLGLDPLILRDSVISDTIVISTQSFYDTITFDKIDVHTLLQDTIEQVSTIKKTQAFHQYYPSDTNIYLYLKAFSDSPLKSKISDSSLFSLSAPQLKEVIIDTILINDTTVPPETTIVFDTATFSNIALTYHDYFVNEINPVSSNKLLASGAAGRYVKFAVDLTSFWNNMEDSLTGGFKYKYVPKAELTVSIDSVFVNPLFGTATNLIYTFLPGSFTTIEPLGIDSVRSTGLISDSTTVTVQLDYFLQKMKPFKDVTNYGYLYLWPPKEEFAHVFLKECKNDSLPFKYVLMNTK